MTHPFLTPAERLCVLLSYHRPSPAERAGARALARSLRSWDELWTLADANQAAPLVHHGLRRLGLVAALPATVRARFERRVAEARVENETRLALARGVLAALVARRLPVVVLKGAFLAEAVYRDRAYKRMNDLDLLVRLDDLPRVYAVYDACGLHCLGARTRRAHYTHHAPPHVAGAPAAVIDTQWGLVTPLAGYRLDPQALWARAEPFTLAALPLRSLAPEDNLHHLCLHLGAFKTALGDLADLYNLLRHESARFRWELFLDEVRAAGTAAPVHRALTFANRLCPMVEVEEALAALVPRVPRRAVRRVRRRTARLAVLLRIGTDHLERIQRHAAELAARGEPHERWRAFGRLWLSVLAPPRAVAQQLAGTPPAPGPGALLARLLAPARVLRAFAADVGLGWLLLWIVWTGLAVVRAPTPATRREDATCDSRCSA